MSSLDSTNPISQSTNLQVTTSAPEIATSEVPRPIADHSDPLLSLQTRELAPLSDFYGNKHDNLKEIEKALGGIAYVPNYFGLSDAQVKATFSEKTLNLWGDLQKAVETDSIHSTLFSTFHEKLIESVKEDILMSFVLTTEQKQHLSSGNLVEKRLIVRSSSNEDAADGTNAGGNLSLPGINPSEESLKCAVAQVVASYFDLLSLKNRSGSENPFKNLPLCSVLIMEEITENAGSPITSGVMMTHKPAWSPRSEGMISQISASYGFGAGVSGSIPADQWILTKDQNYATIRNKTHRATVLADGTIKETSNDPVLKKQPCLSEPLLQKLQQVAIRLEDHFKTAMDVEFVVKGDTLYVVQARFIRAPEIAAPTFLDPSQVQKSTNVFFCHTLVSGNSQVLTLEKKDILLAKDLEEAHRMYRPSHTKAIIVYTAPESCNTHPEVQFASERPPIPCFMIPKEEYSTFKDYLEFTNQRCISLCPQTGIVILSNQTHPTKEGLFIHPGHAPITVSSTGEGVQSSKAPPEVTALQNLLRATPEELTNRLDQIQENLETCYAEIFTRIQKSKHLDSFKQVAGRTHELSTNIFKAMKTASESAHPMHLSLHASMLSQSLHQKEKGIVGADSLSGLMQATTFSQALETFIKTHSESPLLCELALVGPKAFTPALENRWLSFLEENKNMSKEQGEELSSHIKTLTPLGMLTSWLSIHFSQGTHLPQIEDILKNSEDESLAQCLPIQEEILALTTLMEQVSSKEQLTACWSALQEKSAQFITFHERCPKPPSTLLELTLSKTMVDLIQLWDLSTKTVKLSKLFPQKEEADLFSSQITAFANFGLRIATMLKDSEELKSLIEDQLLKERTQSSHKSKDSFSVEPWLIPMGHGTRAAIDNADKRLTVLHQNLLRKAQPIFSPEIQNILPEKLANAVRIFETNNPAMAKRYGEDTAKLVSISEDTISVTLHIPLNFHSFMVTLSQKKGEDNIELKALWKGSDNDQGRNLPFLELFSICSGIAIKSYHHLSLHLEISFETKNSEEIVKLSKAIDAVNYMSLDFGYRLSSLIDALHIEPLNRTVSLKLQRKEQKNKIFEVIWNQFLATGKMSPFTTHTEDSLSNFIDYLKEKNLYPEIVTRLRKEIQGILPPPSDYTSKVFANSILESLPLEEQKELIWEDLTKNQLFSFDLTLYPELLERLCKETPEKALSFYKKHSWSINQEAQVKALFAPLLNKTTTFNTDSV